MSPTRTANFDIAGASLAHPLDEFLGRPAPLRADDLFDRSVDEGLAHRLIDVDQDELGPIAFSNEARPLSNPPAHRCQVECSKHPSHVVVLPLSRC